ncbi:hypothetical protein G9C98_007181 [Cotesia typhae]|uniref:Uncharacterized protein n=1 Tax=Cotesia typhae TaxID=2053667 RepID=A0A8J5R4V3_9HYME|nr:hypothetical protein G9C98_007181 [Cotesia typhae]
MTQSVAWSLVSTLIKNNLKTGTCRFINLYNTTNVRCSREPDLIKKINLKLPGKISAGTRKTNFENEEKKPEISVSHARAALALVKTLDVTRDNALSVVSKHEPFEKLSTVTIVRNYCVLRDADVDKSTLRVHMYALANTTRNLRTKINYINDMKLEINAAIPLLQLPMDKLKKMKIDTERDRAVVPNFNNRVEYLASNFKCSLDEMCSILIKNQFMLPIRMERLKKITELLIAEGMPGENIKNDLHIYKFSLEKIKERIDRAKEVGIESLKPWIIRCPPESFDNIEEKKINKMNLLSPHGKLENYISSFFNCDQDLVEGLIKRDPSLLKTNVKNLSKVLSFLHSKGYLFEEIFRQPRVLHRSEKTLRDRYDKWFECYAVHPPIKVLVSPTHTAQICLKETNKIT